MLIVHVAHKRFGGGTAEKLVILKDTLGQHGFIVADHPRGFTAHFTKSGISLSIIRATLNERMNGNTIVEERIVKGDDEIGYLRLSMDGDESVIDTSDQEHVAKNLF